MIIPTIRRTIDGWVLSWLVAIAIALPRVSVGEEVHSPEPQPPEPPTIAAQQAFNEAPQELMNSLGTKLVLIPPGIAWTNVPDPGSRYPGNMRWNTRRLTIPNALYVSTFEVTQKEYQQIMGDNPSPVVGDDLPVTNMRWEQALKFCRRLSMKEKQTYRLPSEIEWEYACRAGTRTKFHYGDTIADEAANFRGFVNFSRMKGQYPSPMKPVEGGGYAANAFRLYDMHGNVAEWCLDGRGGWNEPHAVRGGSFKTTADELLSGRFMSAFAQHPTVGFRIVRELTPEPWSQRGDAEPERILQRLAMTTSAKVATSCPVVFIAPLTSDCTSGGGIMISMLAQALAQTAGGNYRPSSPRILPDALTVSRTINREPGDFVACPALLESIQALLGASYKVVPHLKRHPAGYELSVTTFGPGLPDGGLVHQQQVLATDLPQLPGLIALQTLESLKIRESGGDKQPFNQPILPTTSKLWFTGFTELAQRIPRPGEITSPVLHPIRMRDEFGPRSVLAWSEYLTLPEFRWRALHDLERIPGPKAGTEIAQIKALYLDGRLEAAFEQLLSLAPGHRRNVGWHSCLLECAALFDDESLVKSALECSRNDLPEYAGRIIRGRFLVEWAWHARGNGVASTVKEEDLAKFRSRLDEAIKELGPAVGELKSDSEARHLLINAAMGLGRPIEETFAIFKSGVEARPDSFAIFEAMREYLRPQWCGTPEAMLSFGEICARKGTWENGIRPLALDTFVDAATTEGLHELRREVLQQPQCWQTLLAIRDMAKDPIPGLQPSSPLLQRQSEARAVFAHYAIVSGHARDALSEASESEKDLFSSFDVFAKIKAQPETKRFLRDILDAEARMQFERFIAKTRVALAVGELDIAESFLKQTQPRSGSERSQLERCQLALAQARRLQKERACEFTPQDLYDAWLLNGGSWVIEGDSLVVRAAEMNLPAISCPFGFGPAEISGLVEATVADPVAFDPVGRHLGRQPPAQWFIGPRIIAAYDQKFSASPTSGEFRCLRTDQSITWTLGNSTFEPVETDLSHAAGFSLVQSRSRLNSKLSPMSVRSIRIRLLSDPAIRTKPESLVSSALSPIPERLQVPNANLLEKLTTRVTRQFGDEFKSAATVTEWGRLAEKILASSISAMESGERYASFVVARDCFVRSEDLVSAVRVIDQIADVFNIDPLAEKVAFIKTSLKSENVLTRRRWALFVLNQAENWIASEDFVIAEDCLKSAETALKGAENDTLVTRLGERRRLVNEYLQAWKAAEAARKELRMSSLDHASNLAIADYLCFFRRQWHDGVTRCLLSGTPELVQLANVELSMPLPVTRVAFEQAASEWFTYATRQTGVRRQAAYARSAYWYEKAVVIWRQDQNSVAGRQLALALKGAAWVPGSTMPAFEFLTTKKPNWEHRRDPLDCGPMLHTVAFKNDFNFSKSWVLAFDFKTPNLDAGLHMLAMVGDDEPGHDAMFVRCDGPVLTVAIGNTQTDELRSIATTLDPSVIQKWVNLVLVYDSELQEMLFYLDKKLIGTESKVLPLLHRPMPFHYGGAGAHGQRFTGLLNNTWFGNTPSANAN